MKHRLKHDLIIVSHLLLTSVSLSSYAMSNHDLPMDAAGIFPTYHFTQAPPINLPVGSTYRIKQDDNGIRFDKYTSNGTGTFTVGFSASASGYPYRYAQVGNNQIRGFDASLHLTYFYNELSYLNVTTEVNQLSNHIIVFDKERFIDTSNYRQNAITAAVEWGTTISDTLMGYLKFDTTVVDDREVLLASGGRKSHFINHQAVHQQFNLTVGGNLRYKGISVLSPYLTASYVLQLLQVENIYLSELEALGPNLDHYQKYGIGFNANLTNSITLYSEIAYLQGSKLDSPLIVSLGVSLPF